MLDQQPEDRRFDLLEFLPYLLNQAAEVSSLDFQKTYKSKYGMMRTEWRVLFHLGMFGEMTASDIVTRAKIHKTKVSRAVQKLVERRFVKRTRSEADRRQERLVLTPNGETAYRDLRGIAKSYDDKITRNFSAKDVATLRQMLRHLAEG